MKIKMGTIIRTAVLLLALVNQVLVMSGHSVLPIQDDQITAIISSIWTIGASVWAWWKNNSFTSAALAGDQEMARQKLSKMAGPEQPASPQEEKP